MKKTALLAFSLLLQAAAATAGSLADGLCYYNRFDGSAEPAFALGSKESSGGDGFADGLSGKALRVSETPFKAYAKGNFNYPAGAVSFWFKPAFLAKIKAEGGSACPFKATNFQLCYQQARQTCFFMTGSAKAPDGFKWDYGVFSKEMASWKDGQWHHIAFSWDSASGVKTLLFDGKAVSSGSTVWMKRDAGGTLDNFLLEAPGDYEELCIWDRPASTEELAGLATGVKLLPALLKLETPPAETSSKASVENVKFEVAKSSSPAKSVLAPGETFKISVPAENRGSEIFDAPVKASLIDYQGRVLASQELRLSLPPGAKGSVQLSFKAPLENGVCKISLETPSGKSVDAASFAIWPEPKGKPDPESFFGNHINSWAGGRYLDQAARLGQGWARNHNMLQATWWKSVQPEPGEFKWEASDALVEDHLKRGINILGQLFGTPYWAAQGGPIQKKDGYPPPILPQWDLWEKYVYETVLHFKGRIKYWEILNEPEVGIFWGGSTEDFAKACQIACLAAKKADPGCFIMAGGLTYPAWKWHEAAAKAGAFKYADAISFHYGCPAKSPEESERELKSIIGHFNELSARFEPQRRLPLWDTEGGAPFGSWLDGLEIKGLPAKQEPLAPENWRRAASRVVQGEAIIMAQGIPKHFIYLQNNGSPHSLGEGNMLDINDAPTPKLMARVAMASLLDDSKFAGEIRRKEGRFWCYLFERKDAAGSLALCWAGDGGLVRLSAKLPPGTKLLDIMANELPLSMPVEIGDEAAYLKSPASVAELRASLEKAELSVVKEPSPLKDPEVGGLKADVPALPDFVAPMENPSALFTVDLRPYCNMGFADEKAGDGVGGWSDEGPYNDLRDMPVGKLKIYGVPFEVIDPAGNGGKSVITLRGATSGKLPLKAEIKVPDRKCRALYFLHAAAWGSPGLAGQYVIRYADGSSQTVDISLPENCNNWWFGYNKDEVSLPFPVKVSNTADGKPAFRYLRVFEVQTKSWNSVVRSIEFISKGGPQVPILIAVSGV